MIHFSLRCDNGHDFDSWFRNNDEFEAQTGKGLVDCPYCGTRNVSKALMAPSVSTGRKREQIALAVTEEQKRMLTQLKELAEKVRQGAEDVGDRFAEEARKIHFGETEQRGIYGQATAEEARALIDDGVEFLPLPAFPDDRN